MNLPGPESPSELYVVRTDRAALHRIHGRILVLHGVLALVFVLLILLVGSLQTGWYAMLPFLILLAGQIFQLSRHSFIYGGRLAISEPLTLNTWGFAMNTPHGRVEMPWEAVAGVAFRKVLVNRVHFLQLHPNAGPGSPGVQTDVPDRHWNRIRRNGLMLGPKGIHADLDEVAAAIGHFSGGRARILTP